MTRSVSRTLRAGHTLIAPHPLDAPPGASQRLRSVTLSFERPEPGK
jgi:hypothetical protein